MAKPFKLNGVDMSTHFTRYGYTVSYKSIRGNLAGYMLDGSYTDDVRDRKAVVTLICMPQTDAQMKILLEAVLQDYVPLEYYDPRTATMRSAMFMPSDPEQKYRGKGADGNDYWTGTKVEFTEK